MRQFSKQWGIWGPWNYFGNQTGVSVSQWDPMLVGTGWIDMIHFPFLARVNLFHAIQTSSNSQTVLQGESWRTASLFTSNPSYTYNVGLNTTALPMYPKTIIPRLPGNLHVWGTDTPAHHPYVPVSQYDLQRYGMPATRLRERFWNGGTWNFTDHGNPLNVNAAPFILGPTASVWAEQDDEPIAVVAMASDNGRPLPPTVEIRIWDNGRKRWGWQTLGRPHDRVTHLRAPLVCAYQRGGETRIRIFVVGLDDSSGVPRQRRWKLYSIERYGNGFWQSDQGLRGQWNNHGEAPDVSPYRDGGNWWDESTPYGFNLTQAVVWSDQYGSRVNIFGHSDVGDQMPEFFYNGSRWQWGLGTHKTPVAGTVLRCNGIARTTRPALNGNSNQFRIGVYAELSNGQVWERYYDTFQGGGWTWLKLR
ncbi:MAG: hypothetical protein OHK0029_42310 [Armatimonadaceae bacterium]